jgi:hypothetical protein
MLIIEYFNVISQGNIGKNMHQSKFKQVLFAALLGLIPGCIGGFAAVSMFTHNLLNFGALTANMIASLGDESFVILSMNPTIAIILNVSVFLIAIIAGVLINMFIPAPPVTINNENHMVIHKHETSKKPFSFETIKNNLLNISFQRAILILGLLLFLLGLFTGQFGHGAFEISGQHETSHKHDHEGIGIEVGLFALLAIFTLYILLWVDEHFLEDHLWNHIIKKHFLRIFLWTIGALTVITLLLHFVDLEPWLAKNHLILLMVAVLVGIIPESGPHLLFVTLYFSGQIPFSVLLANSIVQDGHSALPLLAESKKSFFLVKGINLAIGLLFGMIGYWMGW